nr:transmembrane protein 191C-like [Aegilops tauschii subsp. strangulata]
MRLPRSRLQEPREVLRDLDNAKAEASLKVSHEACSQALEEAHEADRRHEAAEKHAWEFHAWSASLEQQMEARRAALASLRGAPVKEEEVRKHAEALALEAVERSLELEQLETRECQVTQAEDVVGVREPRVQEEVDRRVAEVRAELEGRYDLKLKLADEGDVVDDGDGGVSEGGDGAEKTTTTRVTRPRAM